MPDRGSILRLAPLYLLAAATPFSVSGGNIGTGLVLAAALAALVLGGRDAVRPERTVTIALFAFLGWHVLATAASPFAHDWRKLAEELWIMLLLPAVPVLAGRDAARLERVLKTAVICGGLVAVYAFAEHFIGRDLVSGRSLLRPQFGHVSVRGFFSHHMSYAGQVLIYLLMTAAWAMHRPSPRRSTLLGLLTALFGLVLVWTFSRSALLGVLAGLPLLVLAQPARVRRVAAAAGLAGLAGLMAIGQVRHHFLAIFDLERHETRLLLWRSTLHGLRDHPVFGFGPGNFHRLMELYRVPGRYEADGHAHHDLLMDGANAGVPAMVLALVLLAATILVFARAARRSARYRWIMVGGIAVQAAITVAGLFQVYQSDDEVEILLYFTLGIVLALAGQVLREPADPPQPSR